MSVRLAELRRARFAARSPAPLTRAVIEAMEPRRLHSADLSPLGSDVVTAALGTTAHHRLATTDVAGTLASQSMQEIAFVDMAVPDAQAIVDDLQAQRDAGRTIEVVRIEAGDDGIALIGATLSERSGLGAVHVISHGDDGLLQLGAARLDSATLLMRAGEVASWSTALTADADLLVYGCDLAAGATGRALVADLAALTGADVAASTDRTGAAAAGGDWQLELATGPVEATLAPSAAMQAGFGGALAAEVPVNTTTAGSQTTFNLTRGSTRAVASDNNGNYVVVWSSQNQDGDGWGVYARRFDVDGNPLSGEIRVNSTVSGDQMQASVAMSNTGDFAVVWTSTNQDGSGQSVYWTGFNADGTRATGEIRANTTNIGDQFNPAIGMRASNGDVVVAWQGEGPGDSQGIFFRRFAFNGGALDTTDQRANLVDRGNEGNPTVAVASNGDFVIAYDVANHVYFQRFDASGAPVGTGTQVDNLLSRSTGPAIAMDNAGNFTIVYRETQTLTGVWGRGYNADGTLRQNWFYVAGGDATSPTVAYAAGGDYIVAYQAADGSGSGIYTRSYAADGTVQGAAVQVNSSTDSDQLAPSVAFLRTDRTITVWSGASAGDGSGVTGLVLSTANGAPTITSAGAGDTASLTTPETRVVVTTVTATDPDGDGMTYSLAGGDDFARFTIDAATGTLRFIAAPDYEAPADANGDNVYIVTVRASDGSLSDTQTLSIAVTDVGGPLVVTTGQDVVDGNTASVETLLLDPGADGVISLREALTASNATAGIDTIVLPAGLYTIGLAGTNEDANVNGDLDVLDDVVIQGAGVGQSVISGANQHAVMHVVAGHARLSDLSLTDGRASYGAGIEVNAGASLELERVALRNHTATLQHGAALYNAGALTLVDVELSNNVAAGSGGAIMHVGTALTMERVTLAGNQAAEGGGLAATNGTVSMVNVTLSGNVATGNGGGALLATSASLTNVSVIGNQAANNAGGGLHTASGNPAVSLRNVLLANNLGGNLRAGSGTVSLGHNLSTDNEPALDQATDLRNVAIVVGTLADNGGVTRTHALLPGSAAVDAGDSVGAPVIDQRGATRDAQPDIGAYELDGVANQPPQNSLPGTASVAEDTWTPLAGVQVTDPDDGAGIPGWGLSQVELSVGSGRLTLDLQPGVTLGAGTLGSAGFTLQGPAAALQATLATLRYLGAPDFVGTDMLTVRSTDGGGLGDTDTVTIAITAVNDAPTLAAPLADQVATQGAAFSFAVPAGTFADVDAGDTLTLDARRADGSALPAWLSFDAATGTFAGTPGQADVGTLTLRVGATDAAGARVVADFMLMVVDTNDAPTLVAPLADQGAQEDLAFSYTLPAGTFADIDPGDTLALDARRADGSALPAWLSFDAATGTFRGTPAATDVGTITVRVSATDPAGARVFDDFVLGVSAVNDLPVVLGNTLTVRGLDSSTVAQPDLRIQDEDTAAQAVTVEVQATRGGRFALTGATDQAITAFTLAQLQAGEVVFVTAGDGSQPGYDLRVVDDSGLPVPVAPVQVTVLPSDSAPGVVDPAPATPPQDAAALPPDDAGALASPGTSAATDTLDPSVAAPAPASASASSSASASTSASTSAPTAAQAAPTRAAGAPSTSAPAGDDPAAELPNLAFGVDAQGGRLATGGAIASASLFGPPTNTRTAPGDGMVVPVAFGPVAAGAEDAALDMWRALNLDASSGAGTAPGGASVDAWRDLFDGMRDDLRPDQPTHAAALASGTTIGVGVSVGYVVWILRGGVLLSSMLAALPAWQLIDPMPLLARSRLNRDDERDGTRDDVESLFGAPRATAEASDAADDAAASHTATDDRSTPRGSGAPADRSRVVPPPGHPGGLR